MKYTEKLLWILDKDTEEYGYDEEKFRINIDFVHSLGLKCDCVGWSTFDLGDPKAEFYLAEIAKFCKENGYRARGYYTRLFAEPQSSWYQLGTAKLPSDAWDDYDEFTDEDGETAKTLGSIKAYMLEPHSPKEWYRPVPARVKNALTELGVENLTFCWIRDKGRYESEQYYHLYAHSPLPFYYSDRGLEYEIRTDVATEYPYIWKRILALGGMLPKVASIFYKLRISLPTCYHAPDLSENCLAENGLAEVYRPNSFSQCLVDTLLIRDDLAQKLLASKAITPRDLLPVPVANDCPPGYWTEQAFPRPEPTAEFIAARERERLALEAKPRPRRSINEKQALTALRRAKRERKEDFGKALPQSAAESLSDTPYAPLAPYYAVTSGGALSDEYQLLPYPRATEETKEFLTELQAEELLESPPEGVVIARCPDGDRVLLTAEARVIRFSHEAPEIIGEWPTLSQFIYDSILTQED